MGAWGGMFGVVVRNHLGDFVAIAAGPIAMTNSAFHAELIAVLHVVLLVQIHCLEEGMKIIFEEYSSVVMGAMNGQEDDCLSFGPIINDLLFFSKDCLIR